MCSKEERDQRIREMIKKRTDDKLEKMEEIVKKITPGENPNSEFISNSYGISDPRLCPQIALGESYIKNLPDDVKTAIIEYTGCAYITINMALRRGKSLGSIADLRSRLFLEYLPLLRKAFSNAPPLVHPMTVYRGIKKLRELRDDNGFSSCSLYRRTPSSFGLGNVFEILLPIGTRVLFVKPISRVPGEDEVLLDCIGEFRELTEPGKLVYMTHI